MDLTDIVLPELLSNHPQGLEPPSGLVFPAYNGSSLYNLPGSVGKWLGQDIPRSVSLDKRITRHLDEQYEHVVVLLIDGLGYDLFKRFVCMDSEIPAYASLWKQLGDRAVFSPLTSVVPSTTATALTTLWTGRQPAEHAVIGYELWLKEFGTTANMILCSPSLFSRGEIGSLRYAGFQPETFLPVPTISPYLDKRGVKVNSYIHSSIAWSNLSNMHMPGAKVTPFHTLSDLWVGFKSMLTGLGKQKSYTYIYWGNIDELSHLYGPADERVLLEFASFSFQMERFLERLQNQHQGKVLFVLTADHGLIDTPVEKRYDLRNYPQVDECLYIAPTGEHRFAYLYPRQGAYDRLCCFIEETWGDDFWLVPSEKLVSAGIFGDRIAQNGLLRERSGDLILIARENAYWWWAKKDNLMRGRHGGLSRNEMLVPFFAFER